MAKAGKGQRNCENCNAVIAAKSEVCPECEYWSKSIRVNDKLVETLVRFIDGYRDGTNPKEPTVPKPTDNDWVNANQKELKELQSVLKEWQTWEDFDSGLDSDLVKSVIKALDTNAESE